MTQIITLTTDFGLSDYYVGVVKGVILTINPDINLVDINNSIEPQNILGAAINIKKSYRYFPRGTIHMVVVDPGVGGERDPIIVKTEDYFFVGPDNGVFTLIYGENPYKAYKITNNKYFLDSVSSSFHARDIFAPVSAHLSLLNNAEIFGEELKTPREIVISDPRKSEEKIIGEVLFVDRFGNMITNIRNEEMKLKNEIVVDGVNIGRVKQAYSSVKENELLAIHGSSGFLEIAENCGRAVDRFRDKPSIEILIK